MSSSKLTGKSALQETARTEEQDLGWKEDKISQKGKKKKGSQMDVDQKDTETEVLERSEEANVSYSFHNKNFDVS